jgi:hypothetical protein
MRSTRKCPREWSALLGASGAQKRPQSCAPYAPLPIFLSPGLLVKMPLTRRFAVVALDDGGPLPPCRGGGANSEGDTSSAAAGVSLLAGSRVRTGRWHRSQTRPTPPMPCCSATPSPPRSTRPLGLLEASRRGRSAITSPGSPTFPAGPGWMSSMPPTTCSARPSRTLWPTTSRWHAGLSRPLRPRLAPECTSSR